MLTGLLSLLAAFGSPATATDGCGSMAQSALGDVLVEPSDGGSGSEPPEPPPSGLAALAQRLTPPAGTWDSEQPYPRPRMLTMWYTLGSVCLGLTMGAQGPAAIKMAEQCDFVRIVGTLNGSDAQGQQCGGGFCTELDERQDLVSCGDHKPLQRVGCDVLDTSDFDLLGVATGFDALAGLFGCSLGAFLGSVYPPWHVIHVSCMMWTGLAFIAWTSVSGFWSMFLAAAFWGFTSVVPNLLTQPALTWVWAGEVAPWMSLFHAGFGLGSLAAPVFVSFDLRSTGSFHHAYWLIGLLNILICVPVLGLPSPQPTSDPKPGGEAEAKQSVLDPSAWRHMLTGVESQQAVGGDWRMWFHWYACFFWYAAFEIGFSAWISPFATLLELVEDESTAALLTTCFYIPFTITRTSGLFLARQFNSVQLFRAGFTGALLSLIIVGLSGSVGSPMMLWGGTAVRTPLCCACGLPGQS